MVIRAQKDSEVLSGSHSLQLICGEWNPGPVLSNTGASKMNVPPQKSPIFWCFQHQPLSLGFLAVPFSCIPIYWGGGDSELDG